MNLKSVLYAVLILLTRNLNAQDIGLKIGDKLPDFKIEKLVNATGKTLNTGDFTDRLMIIDFWATNCGGCVYALPKMDSLQKVFGNRVKILPVTYENESLVKAFWKNNAHTKNLSLSSVVEDRIFSRYFKHRAIPHEVWVYKGKVVAITDADFVDAKNIRKVLTDEKIDWPVKNDFYVFDGTSEPLFKVNKSQADPATLQKYAAISGYKDGVSSSGLMAGFGIVRDTKLKTIRAFLINAAVFNAYHANLMSGIKHQTLVKPAAVGIAPNEIIWEVSDKSRYKFDPKIAYQQQWVRENAICFESLNQDTGQSDLEVRKTVISDLDRLLGLKVRWEKRKEKVLVVIKDMSAKLLRESANGTNISNLVYQMNQQEGNPYVFNESGIGDTDGIPVKITDFRNLLNIKKVLAKFGIALKEEERLVDKLVFTEVNERLVINGKTASAARARRVAQAELRQPSGEEGKAFLTANKDLHGVTTLPSGLQYKIIKSGQGAKPTLSDQVKVNYTGTLVNGKIFDSSLETGRPATFALTDVIEGWKQALPLMSEGSEWILYVPSSLAYGERTSGGSIPPHSTLVFELELLKVIK